MTRLDLGWVCSSLARFVQYPGQAHMDIAMHALAYLRFSVDKYIIYSRPSCANDVNRLWGWVDADYAGCPDTRKSHTGYVLMLNGGTISWKSKRQSMVSLSSAESEYIAAGKCSQEVLYLREILRGFNCKQLQPTIIYEDNQACIAMSENQVHRERSKHIDVRKYFVRDLVEAKLLKLVPCNTKEMVVDALTMSLAYPSFEMHRINSDGRLGVERFCAYPRQNEGGAFGFGEVKFHVIGGHRSSDTRTHLSTYSYTDTILGPYSY